MFDSIALAKIQAECGIESACMKSNPSNLSYIIRIRTFAFLLHKKFSFLCEKAVFKCDYTVNKRL
jgi:hypothetical protein